MFNIFYYQAILIKYQIICFYQLKYDKLIKIQNRSRALKFDGLISMLILLKRLVNQEI